MTPDEELRQLREESIFMKRLVGYQDTKIESLINQIQSMNEQATLMKTLLAQSAQKLKELEETLQKDDRPVNPIVQLARGRGG